MGPISTRGLGFTLGFFLGLSFLVKGQLDLFFWRSCAQIICVPGMAFRVFVLVTPILATYFAIGCMFSLATDSELHVTKLLRCQKKIPIP